MIFLRSAQPGASLRNVTYMPFPESVRIHTASALIGGAGDRRRQRGIPHSPQTSLKESCSRAAPPQTSRRKNFKKASRWKEKEKETKQKVMVRWRGRGEATPPPLSLAFSQDLAAMLFLLSLFRHKGSAGAQILLRFNQTRADEHVGLVYRWGQV